MNVTLVPVFSLERSRVEFPGTVILSRVISLQAAVAAAIAEYAVTWQAFVGAVGVGVAEEVATAVCTAANVSTE